MLNQLIGTGLTGHFGEIDRAFVKKAFCLL